jgi:ubiquinone/menaquinone biosynthesis C-methylase UbiE
MTKFSSRSMKRERLDTNDYTDEEYSVCLSELSFINRFLGDCRAARNALFEQVRKNELSHFSLLDIGAGSGQLLMSLESFARAGNYTMHAVGLELNEASVRHLAKRLVVVQADGLRLPFTDRSFDFSICSLLTHHLSDQNVICLLDEMARVSRYAIIVVDLHRHFLAYYLFKLVARVLSMSRLVREDGALSVLRGFKPSELNELARTSSLRAYKVRRSFPFRLVLQGFIN